MRITKESLLQTIQERYHRLSAAHRLLADFLTGHFEEATLLNTEGLAAKAGVSPATVVRFATELGFSGFAALQQAMREAMVTQLSPGYRAARLAEEKPGLPAEVARQSLMLDKELVEQLLREWDEEAVTRATRLLSQANRVLVMGARISSALARYLTYLLQQVRPNVQYVDGDVGSLPELVLDITRGDVLLAISFGPLYWPHALQTAEWARERGAQVIGITDSRVSPMARRADVALCCPHVGLQLQFTLVPAIMLANALANATAAEMPDGIKQRLAAVIALSNRWQIMVRDLPSENPKKEEGTP